MLQNVPNIWSNLYSEYFYMAKTSWTFSVYKELGGCTEHLDFFQILQYSTKHSYILFQEGIHPWETTLAMWAIFYEFRLLHPKQIA